MSVDSFIPEVWAAELLLTLKKDLVFGGPLCTNRNYEGEIQAFGNTVNIGSLSDPTIIDYVKNTNTLSPEVLTTTDQQLQISQSKAFMFEIDDVDRRQVRDEGNLMAGAIQRAGFGLADAADRYLAAAMSVGAGNTVAAQTVSTANDAFYILRAMMVALDQANVPKQGRFVVVDPLLHGVMAADNRFLNAMAYGSTDPIRQGEISPVLGFTILESNNLNAAQTTSIEAPAWAASTEYNAGDQVKVGSAVLEATVGGTSGSTAPAAPGMGATVTDGTVTWETIDLAAAGTATVVAGHNIATTYAEQINKVEAIRWPQGFADVVKGLHLYGAKVIRPEALVTCDVTTTLASTN